MQIRIDNVSYRYPRQREDALAAITCTIGPGITGVIGPNGAGKTTLFRLLLGSIRPTGGMITIGGPAPDAFRRSGRLGFIPDKPVFPEHLSVAAFLAGLQRLAGWRAGVPASLEALAQKRLDSLSLGEARRVELYAATLTQPSVLLLDEPTNALDPRAVIALRNELRMLNDGSRAIIIASHHLDELQRVADGVLIMNNGRLAGSLRGSELDSAERSLEAHFHSMTLPGGSP